MAKISDYIRTTDINLGIARKHMQAGDFGSAETYLSYAQREVSGGMGKVGCLTRPGMRKAVYSAQDRVDNVRKQLDDIAKIRISNAKPCMPDAA